jgi:hypothetical protein
MPKTKTGNVKEAGHASARVAVIAKKPSKRKRSLAAMNKRFAETEDFCVSASEANGMKLLGRKRL